MYVYIVTFIAHKRINFVRTHNFFGLATPLEGTYRFLSKNLYSYTCLYFQFGGFWTGVRGER